MPTIVAVKKNKIASIGADTLTMIGGSRKQSTEYIVNQEKILSYRSNYIGIISNSSLQQTIKSYLSKSKKKHCFDNVDAIFEELRQMHQVFKDDYCFLPECEGNSFESSCFESLIINPHGIFKTYTLRSVQEFAKFEAIGSGAPYALGALHALYDKISSAEELARIALGVAAEFDDSTSLPGIFYKTKLL